MGTGTGDTLQRMLRELGALVSVSYVLLAVAAGAGEVTLRASMQQVVVFVVGGLALAGVLALVRKGWKLIEAQRTFIAKVEADLREPARIRDEMAELAERPEKLRTEMAELAASVRGLHEAIGGNGDAWRRHLQEFDQLAEWAHEHESGRADTVQRLTELRTLVAAALSDLRYPWVVRVLRRHPPLAD